MSVVVVFFNKPHLINPGKTIFGNDYNDDL